MKTKYSIIILNALPDKKIKSLGNKCLININRKSNVIDHHISLCDNLFDDPEIVIVGGFDSKRLKRYIDTNLSSSSKKIKYIEHDIDDNTNIGTSLQYAINNITNNSCFILNSSVLLARSSYKILNNNLTSSFVVVNNDIHGNIGYTSDNNKLINCYYDLPSNVLDCLHIVSKDFPEFYKICQSDISRYYLFEVMNKCIEHKVSLKVVELQTKMFNTIDSANSIKKLREKSCII